jgi:metal-responsive CopG/Arc/MetJ family transcriptional regulator
MDHEFAHGLFYTNKAYKTEMMELVLSLKRDLYEQLESYLIQIGYTSHVIADEIQAYMATGLTATMAKTRGSVTAAKKFEKIFKKYKKQYGKHDNINNPKRQAAEKV